MSGFVRCGSALVAAVGCAGGALATPSTGSITTYADQDQNGNDGVTTGSGFVATVISSGIRTGTSGTRFFNVEGSGTGFQSWGAIRWDKTDLYNQLNAAAVSGGATGWEIQSVSLVLTTSIASFTVAGGPMEAYYVADDTTDINPANGAGVGFGLGNVLGGNRSYNGVLGAATLLNTFPFAANAGDPSGPQPPVDISGASLLADMNNTSDTFLTLVLDTDDPLVAATYRGQDSPFNGLNAPALEVSYKLIPTPGAAALFGVAGLFSTRRRRA